MFATRKHKCLLAGIYSCFLVVQNCDYIEVTGSNNSLDNGVYVRTDDRASAPTKKTLWSKPTNDDTEQRLIFYAGSAEEWRLGKPDWQDTDNNFYYFTSTYCISKYRTNYNALGLRGQSP